MSSAKRRRKAQIARFIRMDATYAHLYLMRSPRRDGPRSWRFWQTCIVPLGDALEKKKSGAWRALPRCKTGDDILMRNFNRRNPK
jgi:hypothetical protein